jgi:RNA polymerase sigma-70 factor (ECF subfamily)
VPDDDPLPWSYAVAKRCLANHRRSADRRLRLVNKLTEQTARRSSLVDPPGDQLGNPRLEAALAGLGEDDRELLRLWAWEQLEPREIAVVLETTPNAVSLRLTRVKAKIASAIERQNVAAAGQVGHGHGREPRT